MTRPANAVHHARRHLTHPPVLTSTHKDCTHCGQVKLLEEFHHCPGSRAGRHSWCKDCRKLYKLDAEANRRVKLRSTYGLTPEDVESMISAQGHRCASCDNPLDRTNRRTQIDHCHATGKVRGVLCHQCNTALGMMRDDPVRIIRLLMYLLRSRRADD